MMPPERIKQLKTKQGQLSLLRTRYFGLMKRYCAVGSLLPTDPETLDCDDAAVWADVEMVLRELAKIQSQMDALRIQAADAEKVKGQKAS